ncbi:hypothetical protein D3C80_776610 [compost metagenome]
MVKLLAENARVEGGIRQLADAKDHVGSILVRIDIIVRQRQIQVQPGIAFCQRGQPGGDVPLPKKHRRIHADHPGRLTRAFVEFPPRILQTPRHGSRIADEKMTTFSRHDRAGIAIEKLLADRIFKLMDNARHLRR